MPDNDVPAVETVGLKKTYFGAVPVEVLHGIDFRVEAGEFTSVLGQSGSGKSTLLNCLGALDRPTEGRVIVAGENLADLDDDELADLRNTQVGFIFQFHYLQNEFTCLENALMPVSIQKGEPDPEDIDRVTDLLERVGLGHRLDNPPSRLSGGEQQRTAIVRALANEPRLVLADEPTGNLDSKSSDQVFEVMREINQETGVAFVMVTHDDRLASRGDRVLRIEDGLLTEE
ncbi:MAG: ABC transporter ATP-binding protein [Armatimonadota bacterium]